MVNQIIHRGISAHHDAQRRKRVERSMDAQTFREALAHWASGVTVVTTLAGEQPIGITASSFSSVSLEPPQVLICVARKLYTHSAIETTGAFAVNILGEEQLEWGKRFAGMIPELEDRFAGLAVHAAGSGCPILSDALAWLDCTLRHAYDGGDHTIFVGEVTAAGARSTGNPLLYFNRNWRTLRSDRPDV